MRTYTINFVIPLREMSNLFPEFPQNENLHESWRVLSPLKLYKMTYIEPEKVFHFTKSEIRDLLKEFEILEKHGIRNILVLSQKDVLRTPKETNV